LQARSHRATPVGFGIGLFAWSAARRHCESMPFQLPRLSRFQADCQMEDEHLLATKDSLAAIVESSDDAILSKDLDGIIRSCNTATERLFGYDCDELIGQSVRILIPPERQGEEDDIMARIRRGERI